MPGRHRLFGRDDPEPEPGREPEPERRIIRDGDTFTIDDELSDLIRLDIPEPAPEPPAEIQGEPWGWTKLGPRPPEADRFDRGEYPPRYRDEVRPDEPS